MTIKLSSFIDPQTSVPKQPRNSELHNARPAQQAYQMI